MICTATYNIAASGHSWQVTACAGSSIGFKGMLFGARVMAAAAVELIDRPELLEAAKKEFDEKMKGRRYICPIPDGLAAPQPAAAK
jgi:aminobenzoyl-glutamate utilization protein B